MNQRNPAISKGIDWLVVWLYIALVFIGIMSIFAATYREGDNVIQSFLSFKTDYSRQLLFFFIGGILAVIYLLTDSKFFTATANLWYAFGICIVVTGIPFSYRC